MADPELTPALLRADAATHWADALVRLRARRDAVAWARGYDSLAEAWAACERGDWMLWLAGRVAGPPGSDSHRQVVLAACACARLALPYVPQGEDRPRVAIETAEAWARGVDGVTLAQVRAAYAAYAAYYSAAYSAYSAAYAAYSADAARHAMRHQCAGLVRGYYPTPPEIPNG